MSNEYKEKLERLNTVIDQVDKTISVSQDFKEYLDPRLAQIWGTMVDNNLNQTREWLKLTLDHCIKIGDNSNLN